MAKKLFVSNKDETVRMFNKDWMEVFSRVHFSVPLILYVPTTLYFLYRGVAVFNLGVWAMIGFFVFGVVIWSFTEYILHRFIFHYQPKSEWGQRLHFIAHGVHHDYPNDSKRLVMPPSVSIPLAVLFFTIFFYILGSAWVNPFFSGFIVGYLTYDMTHYAIHHLNWSNRWFLKVKKHHMIHHYKDPDRGYGVSSELWDKIFGTEFPQNQYRKKKANKKPKAETS